MILSKYLAFTLLIFTGIISAVGQSNSILATGMWIKLGVSEDNIYKISFADLQSYGIDPAILDPKKIRLFGNGGGMLPQANSAARPIDLNELAILVVGEDDGSFNDEDYILFFGNGPDMLKFDTLSNSFSYQNHLFTNTNYYFLNIEQTNGLRWADAPPMISGNISERAYKIYIHEVEETNLLHSGRQWFGEKFDLETVQHFETTIDEIDAGSTIKMVSSVMSTSLQNASFKIKINNLEIGTQHIDGNPDGTYATKGTVALDTFIINETLIGNSPFQITYTYEKEFGVGYLDFFTLQYLTTLKYKGEPLVFNTGDIPDAGNTTFSIADCPSGLILLDISDHNQSFNINYNKSGSTITFSTTQKANKFILFNPEVISFSPSDNNLVDNQNLHGVTSVDLLIISNVLFESQAETLANLRESEGLSVQIVSPVQIYNEFSSGKPDIVAIRDYAKYLYDYAGLKYLLIFGKGTYDPKDILESQLNLIPIYESRNSLQPLATYGSDDFLGFLEDSEGEWLENRSGDHTMDIGVGRIPAINEEEASNYVNKLIKYNNKTALGNWRKDVVFVAENGDQNLHQRDAERLATLIDTTYAAFNTNKIYVDSYPVEVNPGSTRAPLANDAIFDAINQGALIINYTGHGNEVQWAKSKIFDKNVIDSLENIYFLPLFVTATCEFGRHDDTGDRSGGEELIVKNVTGAIAAITTARPVFSSSNYQLNLAFYSSVFEKTDGEYSRLGDIFKKTKNNSLNGVLNRNFSLLGDPSMKLSYAELSVTLDSLNGAVIGASDTMNALEQLRFTGTIRQVNKIVDQSFNGTVDIVIFGKSSTKQTLGNSGATPFNYAVRDNILFNGSATIENGLFTFTTILPSDISYAPASAKISLYAQKADSTSDGSGANLNLLVATSSTNSIIDEIPPEIILFLGDTNFVEGNVVNPNTLLIAKLFDENGINTSTTQIGHFISYTLDDTESEILNNFYTTELDNFSKGWVYFNLPTLSSGTHVISFTAWDTSNNSSTVSLEFYVSENGQIVISDLGNYPNPLNESTTFTFTHNLTGEDIEVTLEILTTSGQSIYKQTRNYLSAPSVIDDWLWDVRNNTGGKINEGIYLYGINIRSKNSNLTQKRYSRLLITN